MYRLEMACQIVHDSIHERRGWTDEYLLLVGDTAVGYGSIAVAGPWKGTPTAYELFVVPHQRLRLFELFRALLFMERSEPFRRRGLGAFLVQELKRVCYEGGHVSAARCNPRNVASRRTLQRAGFVPCGHILTGAVSVESGAG